MTHTAFPPEGCVDRTSALFLRLPPNCCSARPTQFVASAVGQQRSSNDVCVMSAIPPTAARKRTFRHFAFVPQTEVQWPCDGSKTEHRVSISKATRKVVAAIQEKLFSDHSGLIEINMGRAGSGESLGL